MWVFGASQVPPLPKRAECPRAARALNTAKPCSEGTDIKLKSDPLRLATADLGGSLRIWTCWPLPQQLGEFTLSQPCTALAFLLPTLLLGCFGDGSLRLFDAKELRLLGRLQIALPQDPSVAIVCLDGTPFAFCITMPASLCCICSRKPR